jgi:hypothetical protein
VSYPRSQYLILLGSVGQACGQEEIRNSYRIIWVGKPPVTRPVGSLRRKQNGNADR